MQYINLVNHRKNIDKKTAYLKGFAFLQSYRKLRCEDEDNRNRLHHLKTRNSEDEKMNVEEEEKNEDSMELDKIGTEERKNDTNITAEVSLFSLISDGDSLERGTTGGSLEREFTGDSTVGSTKMARYEREQQKNCSYKRVKRNYHYIVWRRFCFCDYS